MRRSFVYLGMDINLNTVLEGNLEKDFFDAYSEFAAKLTAFRENFKSESINNSFDDDSQTGLCTFQVFFFDERNVLDSAFICSTQYEQSVNSDLKFSDFIADELSEDVYHELKNNLKNQ